MRHGREPLSSLLPQEKAIISLFHDHTGTPPSSSSLWASSMHAWLAVQYKQVHGRVEKRDEIRIEIQAPAGCGDSCVESPPSEAEAGCHKFRTFWTTM